MAKSTGWIGLEMGRVGDDGEIVVTFLCKIVSEANVRSHWAAKAKRAKALRELTHAVLCAYSKPELPVTVTLTRIAPRGMDDDNLGRAFKAVRDTVASWLLPHNRGNQSATWADDDDPRISWRYDQRKGKVRQHAVEIRIETEANDGQES